jgi:thymidylate kinase
LTTTPDSRSRSDQAHGDDDPYVRPFIIEFAGTPRAGKTTALHGLRPHLEESGYRVWVVEERARVCPVPHKRHPDFNLWTFSTTLAMILEARHVGADVILVDRGLFDALAWMDWFRGVGVLPDDDHERIDRYLRSGTITQLVDLVLVMTVDPTEALQRESFNGRRPTPGPIINTKTLCAINDSIEDVISRNREFHVEHVDTTTSNQARTLDRVASLVLSHLEPVAPRRGVAPGPPVVHAAPPIPGA